MRTGAARTADGKLAKGYGSRLDAQYGKLSGEGEGRVQEGAEREPIQKESHSRDCEPWFLKAHRQAYLRPEQRNPELCYRESAQNGFVLFTDQEGELIGGLTEEQISELGTDKATIVDRAIEYAKEPKGQVQVVIHKDRDSFRQAVNVRGDAAYLEASQEQRDSGMQDEVHIVLDENTTDLEVSQQLLHEMGHFKFRDLVNDGVRRGELLTAIENLAQTERGVANLIQAVRDNYKDYDPASLEKEIINNYMQAVAFGYINLEARLPESWVVLKTSLDSQREG